MKKATEDFMSDMVVKLKKEAEKAVTDRMGLVPKDVHKHDSTMEGLLKAYTKQDLMEIAKDIGYELPEARKDKMVFELVRQLLEPQTMREQLLLADGEALDAFERAMGKGHFFPADEERQKLEELCDLCYVGEYTDDAMEGRGADKSIIPHVPT